QLPGHHLGPNQRWLPRRSRSSAQQVSRDGAAIRRRTPRDLPRRPQGRGPAGLDSPPRRLKARPRTDQRRERDLHLRRPPHRERGGGRHQ
ncbi:hypothetical protein LTS02_018392, partial [Friedmanniomyces endolithicus]